MENYSKPLTPPPQIPKVLVQAKSAYSFWLSLIPHIPKTSRYTLGGKIDAVFLELIETIFHAAYANPEEKKKLLEISIAKLDVLKLLLQVAWENKLVATEKYAELSKKLQEIGRMLGGWRRGLITLPPVRNGR